MVIGRDGTTGEVAGFLVTKIIGDTAYVDTIASRTSQTCNVNDALVYAFAANARGLPGVTKGHFAIRSYIKSLEHFKWSMGFHPIPFPAVTQLRWPVRLMLKWFYSAQYRRMVGQFDEAIGRSQEALTVARAVGKTGLCSQIEAHLGLFKKHVAFRAGLAVGSPNGSPASSPSRGK